MVEIEGNILETCGRPYNILVVPCSNVLDKKHRLVMSAGFPLLVKRYTQKVYNYDIATTFGHRFHRNADYITYMRRYEGYLVMQIKRDLKALCDLELTARSLAYLNEYALDYPDYTFNMPRPGCHKGGRDWQNEIGPLCVNLPDNVVIWTEPPAAQ